MSTQLAFTSLQLTAYSKDSFNSYQLQQAATTASISSIDGSKLQCAQGPNNLSKGRLQKKNADKLPRVPVLKGGGGETSGRI